MRHTISIIVANQPGELSRIVGLFSARGFNIEAMTVGKTLEPGWTKATIVTRGDERTIGQIIKQCSRLARVREVKAVTSLPHIEREMALIDVSVTAGPERQEVMSLVEIFRAKVVDISHDKMIVEASGTTEKVDTFIEMLKPLTVNDVARSGSVAINRLSPLESAEDVLRHVTASG
jgi:acetolactate synthase I/III small subunit